MRNKYSLVFLIIVFLFFFSNFCFAREFEVDYPALPGVGAITSATSLPGYIEYMFTFGMLIGFSVAVVSLIVGGFLYILSVASPEARKEANSRIFAAISGTVLLATIYLIMTTINPQLRFLKMEPIEEIPAPPIPSLPSPPGVSFYKKGGCSSSSKSDDTLLLKTSSIPDLGGLKNNVRSVKITHNSSGKVYYISVLYDITNYRGKCQYIDPNAGCSSVNPFAASASIYRYSFSPEGDGVTFYRKSFYNDDGGQKKVGNSEIGGIYMKNLEDLEFEDVPKEEQDCVNWDLEGNCVEKKTPTLAGENISSIKIDGNYFVMLIYLDPENPSPEGRYSYSFCQAFPTDDDINKEGPNQIKWEYIRRYGKIPNFVLIFPVEEK